MEITMLTSIAMTASPLFAGAASSLALIAQNLSTVVKLAAGIRLARLDYRDRKQATCNPKGGNS